MTDRDLSGRVAVVTGGASGIGQATSRLLASRGATVVIADIDLDSADQLAAEIDATGGQAIAVATDVTSSADTDACVERTVAEFGRLDILSCTAGMARFPRPAVEIDPDEFDRIFAVNVKGVWHTVRSAVEPLRASPAPAIVVTGSIIGERTRPGLAAYASSKAAANHLTRTLALELAADRIRVNAVAPVATDTAMLPQFLGPDDPEGARERFIQSIPLGRLGQPEDVAEAILYLASDASSFLTGVILPVDGGRNV